MASETGLQGRGPLIIGPLYDDERCLGDRLIFFSLEKLRFFSRRQRNWEPFLNPSVRYTLPWCSERFHEKCNERFSMGFNYRRDVTLSEGCKRPQLQNSCLNCRPDWICRISRPDINSRGFSSFQTKLKEAKNLGGRNSATRKSGISLVSIQTK